MTQVLYEALSRDKLNFSNSLLQSGILHVDYMDRLVALKLGAMEQIDSILDKELLISMLETHNLIEVNREDKENEQLDS